MKAEYSRCKMTARTQKQIEMIKDIYTVSTRLGLKTFFWGGYAVDILQDEWLDEKPTDFYGVLAYTFGIEMAYLLKTNVKLISPEWQLRDKDRSDIAVLEEIIALRGISKNVIKKKVWSHNPYWYAKGYADYFLPVQLF